MLSASLLPDLNFKVCEGSLHHILAQQACVCCTRGLWEVLHPACVSVPVTPCL